MVMAVVFFIMFASQWNMYPFLRFRVHIDADVYPFCRFRVHIVADVYPFCRFRVHIDADVYLIIISPIHFNLSFLNGLNSFGNVIIAKTMIDKQIH